MDYQKAQNVPPNTPRRARLVAALGLDYPRVTDEDLKVKYHGNAVMITYTGLIVMTPEEFALAASLAIPPPLEPVES